MSLEPYDETEAYTVEWDGELGAVVQEWQTTPDSRSFRNGQAALLSLIEKRDATKILVDSRAFDSFPDQTEWLREEWAPQLVAAGVEYVAVVYPEDDVAKFELDKIARMDTDPPVESLFAADVPEARAWLGTRDA